MAQVLPTKPPPQAAASAARFRTIMYRRKLAFDPKKHGRRWASVSTIALLMIIERMIWHPRAGYRVDMEDVEEVKLESRAHQIDAVSGHPGVPPQLEPMGDRSPLASGEITPSDPHRLTMQTLTTKLDNSSILRDAREAAEMAA